MWIASSCVQLLIIKLTIKVDCIQYTYIWTNLSCVLPRQCSASDLRGIKKQCFLVSWCMINFRWCAYAKWFDAFTLCARKEISYIWEHIRLIMETISPWLSPWMTVLLNTSLRSNCIYCMYRPCVLSINARACIARAQCKMQAQTAGESAPLKRKHSIFCESISRLSLSLTHSACAGELLRTAYFAIVPQLCVADFHLHSKCWLLCCFPCYKLVWELLCGCFSAAISKIALALSMSPRIYALGAHYICAELYMSAYWPLWKGRLTAFEVSADIFPAAQSSHGTT